MTGAMMPAGCDCVVPVEKISVADGVAQLDARCGTRDAGRTFTRAVPIRVAAMSCSQPGMRLGPAEVAVIAANGQTHASVSRAPRIVVISTGDELIEPGKPLAEWQIHRSNAYAVMAALQRRGFAQPTLDHLPDDLRDSARAPRCASAGARRADPERRRFDGAIRLHPAGADGARRPRGLSQGLRSVPASRCGSASEAADRRCTRCLATRCRRWSAWCATCLPGWQTSLGRRGRAGGTDRAGGKLRGETGAVAVRARCSSPSSGAAAAVPKPTRGSGDFTSLIGTDGFVELPPGPAALAAGHPGGVIFVVIERHAHAPKPTPKAIPSSPCPCTRGRAIRSTARCTTCAFR